MEKKIPKDPDSKLKELREEAEFGINAGTLKETKGPVQILDIAKLPNNIYSVQFAKFLRADEKSGTSLAIVAVWIPAVVEENGNLKKMLRKDEEGEE